MVITGKKADGRYQVVGKKGEKTAKAPEDIGLNMQREHIDIDDLHQQMVEGMKQARKNVGASTCWDGYKAKGTKRKAVRKFLTVSRKRTRSTNSTRVSTVSLRKSIRTVALTAARWSLVIPSTVVQHTHPVR